jgi:hypothetical protein
LKDADADPPTLLFKVASDGTPLPATNGLTIVLIQPVSGSNVKLHDSTACMPLSLLAGSECNATYASRSVFSLVLNKLSAVSAVSFEWEGAYRTLLIVLHHSYKYRPPCEHSCEVRLVV